MLRLLAAPLAELRKHELFGRVDLVAARYIVSAFAHRADKPKHYSLSSFFGHNVT